MSLLGKKLTIAQHVQELRARLVKCALVACACFSMCYDRIMLFLLKEYLPAGLLRVKHVNAPFIHQISTMLCDFGLTKNLSRDLFRHVVAR